MVTCEFAKTYAALPRTERGQFIVLGGDPKGKNVLYTNGNSVIIRSIENNSESDIYTQHSSRATVAKYSPSGFYIASGDLNGKIRVWDTTQEEHILKCEYQPFAGKVSDLSWSADNTKLAIGGQGREKYGAVINVDTGTNVGEVSGMSKSINNLDIKPTRPFRLATSSEDGIVAFLEGPPFKFKTNHTCHTNFANCLRYSPTGEIFVSAGADGKMFVFDGKTGEQAGEIGSPAHKGGIYAISFTGDGKYLVSGGGDKTLRVWNTDPASDNYLKQEQQHDMGSGAIDDIQVGCVWVGERLVSVSLSGDLNVFPDRASVLASGGSRSVVTGHQKPITGLLWAGSQLVSSDGEGRSIAWDVASGASTRLPTGHKAQIQDCTLTGADHLATVGVDDCLILTDLQARKITAELKLTSQPRKVSGCVGVSGLLAIACYKEIVLVDKGSTLCSLSVAFEPSCIALSPCGSFVVAGGEQSNHLFVYSVSSDRRCLTEHSQVELLGTPRDLRFSSTTDKVLLVCGDSDRKVSLFAVAPAASGDQLLTPVHNEHWKFHTARVSCVALSPDCSMVASGSLDCSIIVWSVLKPTDKIVVKNAHAMSNVTGLAWSDNNTLFSAGQDSNIKMWRVKLA